MPSVFFSDDDMCTTQKLQLARVQDWYVANGWDVVRDPKDADQVISLTCNGWALLEERSYDRIRNFQNMDLKGEIVVFGCVNDAHPKRVAELHQGKTISNARLDEEIHTLIPDCKVAYEDIPHRSTFRTKEDYRIFDLSKRFVNISAGCSFNCSFCTHKPGLGARKSRTVESVVEQVQDLVENHEPQVIVLTGMETSYFGIEHGQTYPEMLKAVLEVDDTFEVHVAQFSPVGLIKYYDDLLPLFSDKRITDIQIPIQTTSTRILKMMRRPPFDGKIRTFLEAARESNTRAIFRTDLIVGWPTETVDELMHTLEFAVSVFDEIAVYGAELNPDLPAWIHKDQAFSDEQLKERVQFAKDFVANKGKVGHSGQQNDPTMASAEAKRQELRASRLATV